jgi:hypothetical protein
MHVKETLIAFVLGAASIFAMHMLYVEVDAQSDDEAVVAAVNEEGSMRLIDPAADPGPGERKVLLKPPPYEPPCEAKVNADVAGLRNRIAALELPVGVGQGEAGESARPSFANFGRLLDGGPEPVSVDAR